MNIEICDEFFYRIDSKKEDVYSKFNSCKDNVLRNNDKIDFYQGEWIKVKVNDFEIHHVKPMETLKDIANNYGVNEEELFLINKLKTRKLFIGQMLKINKKTTNF